MPEQKSLSRFPRLIFTGICLVYLLLGLSYFFLRMLWNTDWQIVTYIPFLFRFFTVALPLTAAACALYYLCRSRKRAAVLLLAAVPAGQLLYGTAANLLKDPDFVAAYGIWVSALSALAAALFSLWLPTLLAVAGCLLGYRLFLYRRQPDTPSFDPRASCVSRAVALMAALFFLVTLIQETVSILSFCIEQFWIIYPSEWLYFSLTYLLLILIGAGSYLLVICFLRALTSREENGCNE